MAKANNNTDTARKELISNYQQLVTSLTPAKPSIARTSIEDEIARERKLKNDDTEQDIELKRKTLARLFLLLEIETAIIFVFSFLQATRWLEFRLDDWSFKLLTTATITQITVMLTVAVNYLFPKKK